MKGAPARKYPTWLKWYRQGHEWPEQMTIVAVRWRDATYAEEISNSGTILAMTVGIVVEATGDHLKIAAEVFEDKSVRDVTTIPAGMIERVGSLATLETP